MEAALRRRLDGVTHVSISQRDQTVGITFVPTHARFAPDEFRGAIAEAGVDVLAITIEACGTLSEVGGGFARLEAGSNEFALLHSALASAGDEACVVGSLVEGGEVLRLEVTEIRRLD